MKTPDYIEASHEGRRPFLDPMSGWRVAKAQEVLGYKSITDSARALIEAGWNTLLERKPETTRPGFVPIASANGKPVTFYLGANMIAELKRIAAIEGRSQSAVVSTLLFEALQARQDRAVAA
jgi:hypothetical protein